jgi:hypothetical protein
MGISLLDLSLGPLDLSQVLSVVKTSLASALRATALSVGKAFAVELDALGLRTGAFLALFGFLASLRKAGADLFFDLLQHLGSRVLAVLAVLLRLG